MFRGANAINLDTKGRLAIPTKYRQSLLDDCQGQLVCTVDTQQSCLLLYPLPEWEEIELKLSKLSSMIPAERRLQRLLLGYASEGEMDKSGRHSCSYSTAKFRKTLKRSHVSWSVKQIRNLGCRYLGTTS